MIPLLNLAKQANLGPQFDSLSQNMSLPAY